MRGFPSVVGLHWGGLWLYTGLRDSQGVKLELGSLRFILGLAWCIWCWGFLFSIDFHFLLDSRQGLGFNLCTMLKYTLKSGPCSYFSTVRLGGLGFTQMYEYIEYYRIIYNILIYFILIFRILLESYGFLWNLLDFYSKKVIEKRIKRNNIRKHLKTNTDRVLYTIRVLCKTICSGKHLVILGIIM